MARQQRLAACLTFLLTFLLFVPTLFNDFVWDDVQVTIDPYIHDSSNWADVLTYRTLARDVIDNNRPAMLLTLMADAAIWGKKPFGFHLTNNLLHAANAALLCLLAIRALSLRGNNKLFWPAASRAKSDTPSPNILPAGTQKRSAHLHRASPARMPAGWIPFVAAATAMLFAMHPLVVEAVSVICFREDAQATFFVLASVWLVSQLDRSGSASANRATILRFAILAGIWLCVLFAVGTKESGIAAALLLLVWALLIRNRDAANRAANPLWIAAVGGATVIAALFLVARFKFQPWPSEVYPNPPQRPCGPLSEWLPFQTRVFVLYLKNIFIPTQLSSYYSPGLYENTRLAWALLLNCFVLGCIVAIAWRSRLAFLGATLLGIGLGAVANLVPIYNPVADRYLYLPLAGGAWLLAGMASRAGQSAFARGVLIILMSAAFIGLTFQNVTRQRVFRNESTLWTDAARKAPNDFLPFNPLGWVAYHSGQYTEALNYFGIALEKARNLDPDSWAGAALCLSALGRQADAERAYREAVSVQPRFRNPRLIRKTFFWRQESLNRLAVIARPTGLWIEEPGTGSPGSP